MYLRKKENKIISVIKEQLNYAKKPMLSLSWGKDSFLLLHYVHSIDPNIDVVFLDSGYGLPCNYEFRDKILSQYNLNYHEVKQQYDYIDLCKRYNLPHLRSVASHKKVISLIKKSQLDAFAKKNGNDLIFWGLRADESKGRFNLSKNGYYFDKLNGLRFVHPLIYMPQFELWYIYDHYKLPVNNIYNNTGIIKKEQIRNSGWLSTDGAGFGRVEWLKRFYPEQFNKLLFYFPNAKIQNV